MSLIKLIKYKSLYNIFILFSLSLYFNKKIVYSKIEKNWIFIKNNKLIWNHKFAELKHVLNNIKLVKKHEDNPPKKFSYQDKLSNLITEHCTKYEKFTSNIVNNIIQKRNNITKMLIMHCKNIRKDIAIDLPLMSLQVLYKTERQDIYKLSESYELTDILNILVHVNKNTFIVCFTDWRNLYRTGYSFSHAKFLLLNEYIINILNKLNISLFSVVMTADTMYAIDIINVN
tara:strand:+ start:361 stop:1050 length:690 start_codon:yes stop_codon:yes gene_type:complete